MTSEVPNLCWKQVGDGENRCGLVSGHVVPCSAEDDLWVPLPTAPFDEIAPGLYQGGSYGETEELEKYDAILTCFVGAPVPSDAVDHYEFHFEDSLSLPDVAALQRATHWAYQQWTAGHRVLIRCQGGLNRSGLITALVLMEAGLTADEAIDRVRSHRSVYALCNPGFVALLRKLDGVA